MHADAGMVMSPAAQTPSATDLNTDVVTEILLRLPSVAVIRFRAVCKSWRRITTSPSFIAAHERHRPLELVLFSGGPTYSVDAIPLVSADEGRRRSLHLQYPELKVGGSATANSIMLASCDGLLLFEQRRGLYLICNPLTRQWTNLPLMAPSPCSTASASGFYLHRPTGEYRLLCLGKEDGGSAAHYVLSTGESSTDEPRRLAPSTAVGGYKHFYEDPVAHRGKLHWLLHPEAHRSTGNMLAFDTLYETFRQMPRPPAHRRKPFETVTLLELTGEEKLAAVDVDLHDDALDLWVLEDYEAESWRWTRRLRVELPRGFDPDWALPSGAEGVLLVGGVDPTMLGLYDLREQRLLKLVDFRGPPPRRPALVTRFIFRDSLRLHAFLDKPRCSELMALQFISASLLPSHPM